MRVALLQRPPRFGAKVKSFDATAAGPCRASCRSCRCRAASPSSAPASAAKQGRDALKIEWDETNAEKRGSDEIMREYRQLADKPGTSARKDGDADAAITGAARKISATYEFPYLAHAPMEPLDAVVKLTANSCEIWAGDQFQTVDQANAARTAGLKPEQVQIHTLYAGGSFGRRANVVGLRGRGRVDRQGARRGRQARQAAVDPRGRHPGGFYRPMYFHKLDAGLTADGKLVGWRHRIVGQSILAGTPFEAFMVKNGVDATSVEGAANLPYAVPNVSVELSTTTKVGLPVLWWRVVGSSHTAYAVEAFIDEAAHTAGKDPYAFRRDLLAKGACARCWTWPRKRPAGIRQAAAEGAGAGSRSPRRSRAMSRRWPRCRSTRMAR